MHSHVIEALAVVEADAVRAARPGEVVGYGVAYIPGTDVVIPFRNLVTTAGDEYMVKMAITGVSPANASAPTKASGMKLGTGTTAVAKSGAGGALVTYLTASNVAFDATFPSTSAVTGTDTGWKITYQTTWAAGVATNSAIAEVVIVNDAGTNATSAEADTYARALLSPAANKASTQALVVVWNHALLGA
jgi:hypothetical protein